MKSPPFCPNPACAHHARAPRKRWYWRSGHYHTSAFGTVQRFICLECAHRFSTQSFSIDYYAKRKLNYHLIDQQLRTTGSIRDITRILSASADSVSNRISRLARNAIYAHSKLRPRTSQDEELVADGFESFCISQYFPNNITILVGKRSQYLHFANYCTLRRKGRMTEEQKKTREMLEEHWRADPKAVRKAFDEVVDQIRCEEKERVLYTDEKREYASAMKVVSKKKPIRHERINSKLPRTRLNPLFSVNYYDREIRKDSANHVRETVCFARNVNNCMERLWVYFTYHNYRKPYRIGRGEERSHGEVAGIDRSDITAVLKGFYTKRSFLGRTEVTGSLRSLWLRELETPLERVHACPPAYARA